MTAVTEIDSNKTGLRFVREASNRVLPGSPVWLPLEPNNYKDFGASYKKVARNPINANRQMRKGVTTDLDVMAGFQEDMTYFGTQTWIEGLFCADFRKKAEVAVSSVAASTTDYEPASGGAAFKASDLVLASGFTNPANNGLKVVTGVPGTSSVPASGGGLVDETGSTGTLVAVGYEFAAGDAEIDASGHLISTAKDLTELGLIAGEWVFLGGDTTGTMFGTATNNGFARVLSVAPHAIVFDRSDATLATDAGMGKTLRIFYGRVLKNELAANIKKYTYQFERTLGAPDDTSTDQQSEYIVGALFDMAVLTFNTADKITYETSVIGATYETAAAGALKAGTRPAVHTDAVFNSTNHIRSAKMYVAGQSDALFAYMSDFAFTFKNNVKVNKAVSVLGGFSTSLGQLQVTANANAYFADIAAVNAVKNNSNVGFNVIMCRDNQGIILDLPLVSLGDGKSKVAQDTPITLALTIDAATAVDLNPATDYTAMMVFFDYLPTSAMVA